MTSTPAVSLEGDASLSDLRDDKLGFRSIAFKIADAIAGIAGDRSFILGLEGQWGSGKSSLLALAEARLSELPLAEAPTIIRFEPWLIGNRDGLLAYLFTELAKSIVAVEASQGGADWKRKHQAKKAGKALKNFAKGIGQVGGVIEVAGDAIGFAPLKWAGKGIAALKDLNADQTPNLDKLKKNLVEALKVLGAKFLVTIDDVDRLDPHEILEVLRLAKSVADLPNISYLLCYDSNVLARSVERAANVHDGNLYLEKIIQLKIAVPKPEPFQLRNWFSADASAILSVAEADRERLREVVDFEGGRQLTTPRAVKKTLDTLRFSTAALKGIGFDTPDLVWLALIKDGNPSLYRWIEEYCGTQAAVTLGTARVDESETSQELDKLLACVPTAHFADLSYRQSFASMLPGVSIDLEKDSKGFKIFEHVNALDRDRAITARRLASVDHYKLYFAFSLPSYSLREEEYEEIFNACGAGPDEIGQILLEWHKDLFANRLSKAELLLERIMSFYVQEMTEGQRQNLLLALSNVMDVLFETRPISNFEFNSIWDRGEQLFAALLRTFEVAPRSELISSIFQGGEAIGWLTSVLRHETFAHGRYGNQQRPEEKRYLSASDLDAVEVLMKARYTQLSFAEISALPRPISLLFAWRQIGDEQGPRALIASETSSNEGFVVVLEAMTNIQRSSDGENIALSKENIEPFMDYGPAIERLAQIAREPGVLRERAVALMQAAERTM